MKSKKNRRSRKKSSVIKQQSSLKIISCNAANLKNKMSSLDNVINSFGVSLFCIQESHLRKKGQIKFSTLNEFQIYELNRELKGGGGLVIGTRKDLKPIWIA